LAFKGLEDAPRSCKPERYIGLREKVLKTLETPPPKGVSLAGSSRSQEKQRLQRVAEGWGSTLTHA
jgi:hypothetical protein